MSNYRRSKQKGGIFFFTVVTYGRRPLFAEEFCRSALKEAINNVRIKHPFIIEAFVLLPDHLHCIWKLPKDDNNYGLRWNFIKAYFTRKLKRYYQFEEFINTSRLKRRESTIWQRRYWEHQIRNEKDFRIHLDYIHFNPVKHDLVKNVIDWEFSSFHKFVKEGLYPNNWGSYYNEVKLFGE